MHVRCAFPSCARRARCHGPIMQTTNATHPGESRIDLGPAQWVGGSPPPPCRAQVLHEIFEAQSDRTPDQIAVIDGARRITYSDLDRRANQLAHFLRARGISRGSLVGILIGRSVKAYVSILATLKAGAAYVPLDPE